MYNYHQSMKHSDLIYKPKQSVEEALKPPWSLNLKAGGDYSENAEKTIPEAFPNRRTQSAPIRQAPKHRIILKIPTPQLQNLFDGEAEENYEKSNDKNDYEKSLQSLAPSDIETSKNNFQITEIIPSEQIKLMNLNENSEVIITNTTSNTDRKIIEDLKNEKEAEEESASKCEQVNKKVIYASNHGKKPLVFDEKPATGKLILRPKTANTTFRRSGSSLSQSASFKERSKSSISKSKSTVEIASSKEFEDKVESENSINVQDILNSYKSQLDETPTQFQYNHFYNNKSQNSSSHKLPDPTVIYIDPTWVDNYLSSKKTNKPDFKVVDGHWKDQLINRRYTLSG